MRARLAHCDAFDTRYISPVVAGDQTAEAIGQLLSARGAPTACHVVSEDPALDGQRMSLHSALARIVGFGMAAVAICQPGRPAYYEGEDPGRRLILSR
jgi:hypothetical protein